MSPVMTHIKETRQDKKHTSTQDVGESPYSSNYIHHHTHTPLHKQDLEFQGNLLTLAPHKHNTRPTLDTQKMRIRRRVAIIRGLGVSAGSSLGKTPSSPPLIVQHDTTYVEI